MENKAQQDDDVLMSLVEQALAQREDQRRAYLERACAGNSELFEQAWNYVRWDERMQGFMIEPLFRPSNPDTHQSTGTLLMTTDERSGAEQPFETGQRLDNRFRIVRELARGGMGIVYEAMDEKLDRRIAIKCARRGFRKRLPPEVRNAREISHPNVCKIFEFHTADTHQGPIDFITMEFLEGETLAERLRRGRLPEAEARAIALQLCAGLAEAHRNRVVHGDLKSNNVILAPGADGNVRAVITDFGLARGQASASKTAQSGEAGGTPDYMAPELWRGEKASPASDVYALGVILYQLAAGRRPYAPEVPWQDRLIGNLAPVDRKWDRILTRCLDPEPARRYQTGDEVAKAFAPSHSRRWLLAAAAAILLVIVSTLVTLQRTKPPRQIVHLAVLPFESSQDIAPLAARLTEDAAVELARLKSSSQTKLSVIPQSEMLSRKVASVAKTGVVLGATHALHGTIEKLNENFTLHVYLTDPRSGTNIKEWKVRYKASELRYAPVAIAGLLTYTLRLPPMVTNATVNAAARQDYLTGLSHVHGNTRIDDAVRLLEQAVAADPDSPLTYAGLAEAQWSEYLLTGETLWQTRAEESVRQAEVRNPDLPEVLVISGLIKADSGFYELAAADYQRAIELQPNNGDVYRRLSGIYSRAGEPDEALTAIQKAVQVQPNYFKNHQMLGSLYIRRGSYRDAVLEFKKMVDLAPNLAESHYALGAALGYVGTFPEAEQELRAAIRLRDSSTTELALGAVLLDTGSTKDAIACFLQAIHLGDESALLWLNLGIAYNREGLEHDAEAAFRSGLAVAEKDLIQDPRDGLGHAQLAYLAARLGDSQRAEFEIGQALQLSRDNSDTCLIAVLTYEALRHREDTLGLLTSSPAVLPQLSRYPELADLRRDPRFVQLLSSNHVQQ
ncbi:MAG: protein kinase [Bryobacteraceae bacterium]|jgi:serine/threonine-protein kinase